MPSGPRVRAQVTVTAECVVCGSRRDIKPGDIPAGETPFCEKCYSPMIAVKASAKKRSLDAVPRKK